MLEALADVGVTSEQLKNVEIRVEPPGAWADWAGLLITIVPLVVFGVCSSLCAAGQGTNNQALSFGKSRGPRGSPVTSHRHLRDVAGVDEAKHELSEVVEFLREPEKFISLRARIPKAC